MNMNIDVHLNMERGMYERLVERAHETGVPMSAVVREAVAQYFENLPVPPDRTLATSIPDDPIWDLPNLSATYGDLSVPPAPREQNQGGTRA
jgi:predicted DNA-binding protein